MTLPVAVHTSKHCRNPSAVASLLAEEERRGLRSKARTTR